MHASGGPSVSGIPVGPEFIEVTENDRQLVAEVLCACDDTDAAFALTLLNDSLPERALLALANLRSAVRQLPDPPFLTELPLGTLVSHGYEHTGRSYRMLFESDHGVFGVEFVGDGRVVEAVLVHTANSRCKLGSLEAAGVEGDVVQVLLNHPSLSAHLGEALEALGRPVERHEYRSSAEFLGEHAAGTAGRCVGELF